LDNQISEILFHDWSHGGAPVPGRAALTMGRPTAVVALS
jgi:hypothetical protein